MSSPLGDINEIEQAAEDARQRAGDNGIYLKFIFKLLVVYVRYQIGKGAAQNGIIDTPQPRGAKGVRVQNR